MIGSIFMSPQAHLPAAFARILQTLPTSAGDSVSLITELGPSVGKDGDMFTHIEVESNENCPMTANMVYKNLGEPMPVGRLRIYDGAPGGSIHAVTGWSSADGGSPVPAYAVQVEDSGLGAAFVVY